MELRTAAIQDIPLISRIHAASWKAAYKGMIPEAYLNTLPEEYWVEPFTNWLRAGELQAIIAWEGDTPAGCVSFGKPVSVPDLERNELPEGCGEVRSLYIHPDHMRRGYGKALLRAAELELRIRGFSHCCLYTLEQNKIARAFYEKNGYVMDGGTGSYEIAGKAITDLRYVKSLACPCPRRCKTHGDCEACRERHKKKKYPCYCLR
ncbi:MAG TPA: GNAT family N-acetyltransferase [Feifaniaceae bacterium]|nr:GNAT family N-acetyltransferase [Feifaniaceae bacterium]